MKRFAVHTALTLLFAFGLADLKAQYVPNRNSWKKQREELIWGVGVANFLGDCGGRNAIGTDYSPIDLEISLTRPSAMLGYRFRFTRKWAVRIQGDYARVWGDDKLTTEPFRSNRNLYFRSNIFEGSANIEYSFVREKGGNRYHFKHTLKRRAKSYSTYLYIFAGVGGFWFNPKAKIQGSWVALQPLGTEGQGLVPGKKKYSRISVSIPMGIGYKVTIRNQWAFGIEFNFRKTFTDYIDDVSNSYADNQLILMNRGPVAATAADPNLGHFPIQLDANGKTRDGLQRGDKKDKDSFMTLMITGGYYIHSNRTKKKTRAKF